MTRRVLQDEPHVRITEAELPEEAFRRFDEMPDALFYRQPRFVTHIDDAAIAAVTQIYREVLPPGGAVLDLMSSWVSHLPPEVTYRRVVGLGHHRRRDRGQGGGIGRGQKLRPHLCGRAVIDGHADQEDERHEREHEDDGDVSTAVA